MRLPLRTSSCWALHLSVLILDHFVILIADAADPSCMTFVSSLRSSSWDHRNARVGSSKLFSSLARCKRGGARNIHRFSRSAVFYTSLAINSGFGQEPMEDRQSLTETGQDGSVFRSATDTSLPRPASVVVAFLLATRLTPGPNLPAVGNGSDFPESPNRL